MRAVRLGLALTALAAAAAAAVLGWQRVYWPLLSELLGLAAIALGLAARLTAIGRHRGRVGAHARPTVLDEARDAAAAHAEARAETAAIRAVIDPYRPLPDEPRPAAPPEPTPEPTPEPPPGRAGRLPQDGAEPGWYRPVAPPAAAVPPVAAARADDAAVALAIAAIRALIGPYRPDPAPSSSYGRTILAPGKIPVYAPGRHERETEEAKS